MKQIGYIVSVLLLCAVTGTAWAIEDEDLAAMLRQVVENNLSAFNSESVAATMESIHSKSPNHSSMQEALPGQFEALDARTELVGFTYMGHDDEFAVARVKLKTVDNTNEPFVENIVDTIAVFHQEDGDWKYWSNHVLGIRLVE